MCVCVCVCVCVIKAQLHPQSRAVKQWAALSLAPNALCYGQYFQSLANSELALPDQVGQSVVKATNSKLHPGTSPPGCHYPSRGLHSHFGFCPNRTFTFRFCPNRTFTLWFYPNRFLPNRAFTFWFCPNRTYIYFLVLSK